MTDRSLVGYNLDDARFDTCTFTNVVFGHLTRAEFITCTLTNCRFATPRDLKPGAWPGFVQLDNVLFELSTVDGLNFDRCTLDKIQFVETAVRQPLRFQGSVLRGVLSIRGAKKSADWTVFSDIAAIKMDHTAAAFISTDLPAMWKWRPTWSIVRALYAVPFLQISVIAVALLGIELVLVGWLSSMLMNTESVCLALRTRLAPLLQVPPVICGTEFRRGLGWGWAAQLAVSLATTGSLLVASIIHKVRCPPQIIEFSKTGWLATNGQPIQYELLDRSRHVSLAITLAFYTIGGGVAVWIFGSAAAQLIASLF